MTYRRVLEWPDKRLKTISDNVDISGDLSFVKDLRDTFEVTGGYGLAAPQIGIFLRAIIINQSALNVGYDEPLVMLNPRIIESEGTRIFREACFSMPAFQLEVTRAASILVEWQDVDGSTNRREFTAVAASCVQHEIDHLDGKLMIDRLSSLKRSMLKKKIARAIREQKAKAGPTKKEISKRKAATTRNLLRAKRKKRKKK